MRQEVHWPSHWFRKKILCLKIRFWIQENGRREKRWIGRDGRPFCDRAGEQRGSGQLISAGSPACHCLPHSPFMVCLRQTLHATSEIAKHRVGKCLKYIILLAILGSGIWIKKGTNHVNFMGFKWVFIIWDKFLRGMICLVCNCAPSPSQNFFLVASKCQAACLETLGIDRVVGRCEWVYLHFPRRHRSIAKRV